MKSHLGFISIKKSHLYHVIRKDFSYGHWLSPHSFTQASLPLIYAWKWLYVLIIPCVIKGENQECGIFLHLSNKKERKKKQKGKNCCVDHNNRAIAAGMAIASGMTETICTRHKTTLGELWLQYVWIGQPLKSCTLVLLSRGAASGRLAISSFRLNWLAF